MNALDAAGFVPGEFFQLAAIFDRRISVASFLVGDNAADIWIDRCKIPAPGMAGSDVYLCLNPLRERLARKAAEADIAIVRALLLDFDPLRDNEDRDAARAATLDCAERVRTRLGGTLIDSGRGHQLWVRHDQGVDRAGLVVAVRAFVNGACLVDATHDSCRLARLPGTINSKTGREARIVC